MMSMAHLRHHICLAMRKARGSVLGTGLGDGKTGRQGTGYSKNEEKRIQSRYPLTIKCHDIGYTEKCHDIGYRYSQDDGKSYERSP
jgi:hypothetical protein